MTATAERVGGAPARSGRGPIELAASLRGGRFYAALAGFALAIGALSLLIPSTPSYDPWSWLVWGREIVHLDLHTTGGPSWKPLPVLFTTVFALFGKAQPDLWLVIARAGAVVTVVMAARLAWRVARRVIGGDEPWPAIVAALVTALSIVFASGFITNNALGYSEGLMTAFVLLAVDRHLDGDHRGAFALGLGAALSRPETWALWGLYGLWLMRRDRAARPLVIGLFAVIPLVWFLPELWGSGHLFRGVSRAQHVRSNSAANASCPFCTELSHAWSQVLRRIKFVVIPAVIVALAVLWRRRSEFAGVRRLLLAPEGTPGSQLDLAPQTDGALRLVALATLGASWWVLIAAMTQAGFSGNNRYLVVGSALIVVAGAVGWAWLTAGLGRLALKVLPAFRAGPALAAAGVVALFLAIPPWIAKDVSKIHRALVYQARLRSGAAAAIERLGGAGAVLRCGTVMTEGFQVPMLAWTLGVHTLRVTTQPPKGAPIGPPPNVIFQTRAQRKATLLPSATQIAGWTAAGAHYRLVATTRAFRVYSTCHA
jgi:hypothetical protein